MEKITDRRVAIALAVVGFLSALVYAFTTPLWQAPDEPSHLGYIEYIDRVNGLPSPLATKVPMQVQAKARKALKWPRLDSPLPAQPKVLAAEEFAYRGLMYTANHPPLYYISARIFGAVAARFMENRLEGLAYGARFFSALVVGLTVALAFLCARLLALSKANSLLAALLLVLQPQFLFIGSSINNDSLTTFLWSAFVYLMLREIRRPHPGHLFAIGVVLGLGLLTKVTFFLALPLTFAGYWLADRNRQPLEAMWRAGEAVFLSVLISGWWFVGNLFKYGSPWYAIGGTGLGPATLLEFFGFSQFYRWLFMSYWGYFGWMEKPLPLFFYAALALITAAAGLGAVLTWRRTPLSSHHRRQLTFLVLASATLFLGAIWFRIVAQTGQGRYLFPGIIPSTLLLWIGLRFWVPDRFKSWLAHGVIVFFAALSGVGLTLIRQL